MNKVHCVTCGTMILPGTAEKNNGRCAPCKKQADTPVKAAPARLAFILAAAILFANAASMALLLAVQKGSEPYVIGIAIDVVLGVFLLRLDERARYFTVLRAALGLLAGGTLAYLQYSGTVVILAIVAQALLSLPLILLLAWETVRWRLILGSALAIIHFAHVLFVMFGSLCA